MKKKSNIWVCLTIIFQNNFLLSRKKNQKNIFDNKKIDFNFLLLKTEN